MRKPDARAFRLIILKLEAISALGAVQLGIFLLLACTLGCPKAVKELPKETVDESKRPPLRILVVGTSSISDTIARRWKSASQQPIDISTISESDLVMNKDLKADVVLFPSRWLGEMVERRWISPLPGKLSDHRNERGGDPASGQWPEGWQLQASYGKRIWGVPLGIKTLALIRSSTTNIEETSWRIQDLPAASKGGDSNWDEKNDDLGAMVDRYQLLLLGESPLSSNVSLFFQLRDMKPRLSEEKFLLSLKRLAQYAQSAPSVWRSDHESAWKEVLAGRQSWALGRPVGELDPKRNDDESPSDARSLEHFLSVGTLRGSVSSDSSPTLAINPGDGLLAALSRSTRQSAPSTFFIEWLNSNDQRESLSRETKEILSRTNWEVVSADHPDRAGYGRILQATSERRDVVSEFRLQGGERYRMALGKMIQRAIAHPDQAQSLLKECSTVWEQITEELGRESQKKSLERSLQLSEVDLL